LTFSTPVGPMSGKVAAAVSLAAWLILHPA
jgi:hypothetical protein